MSTAGALVAGGPPEYWFQPMLQASIPHGIGVLPDFAGPLPRSGQLGSTPATREELEVADAVISKAPSDCAPIDVAKYFLQVSAGAYGRDWIAYTMGWPLRWNPLIVRFFLATGTQPEGDLTPWCAAFVNWCSLRATKKNLTGNASSGSFRSFGKETRSPTLGDVVVFGKLTPTGTLRGHVGFFVGEDATRIYVLGGNQIERKERNHKISQQWFSKSGTVLHLHSFRTDEALHARQINI